MTAVIIGAILTMVLTNNGPSKEIPTIDPSAELPVIDPSPIIFVVPDPPTDLTRNDDLTNQNQVSFTWAAPENDGGEPIIDYTVYMKQDDGFIDLASGLTTKAYTFSPAAPGVTYSFQVQSRNSVGYSDFSSTLEIIAAT